MPPARSRSLEFGVDDRRGRVSALLLVPPEARCLLALAHGAGAGMRHPFLADAARQFAARGVATFRYQFPYMEAGRRRPDPAPILERTVRRAVTVAQDAAPGLPLFAGGKSMGGRMTSRAAARASLPGVRGLVFLGFPLHAAGRPSIDRADHLRKVSLPMLFVQGTRDRLATAALVTEVVARLGASATLAMIDDGDHSFHVRKRSGRSSDEALAEAVDVAAAWMLPQLPSRKDASP